MKIVKIYETMVYLYFEKTWRTFLIFIYSFLHACIIDIIYESNKTIEQTFSWTLLILIQSRMLDDVNWKPS